MEYKNKDGLLFTTPVYETRKAALDLAVKFVLEKGITDASLVEVKVTVVSKVVVEINTEVKSECYDGKERIIK